jgi:hypothetical protein
LPPVRAGLPAQASGLAGQRLVHLPLSEALHHPADLGEQVRPASGELAQRGHRGGLLLCGELAPAGMMPGRAVNPGGEDMVSLRTLIEHGFEYHAKSLAGVSKQAPAESSS